MKRIVLIMTVMLLAGCATHNQTKLSGGEVDAVTTTANLSSIDVEGNITSAYHGIGASNVNVDEGGIYNIIPGVVSVVSGQLPGSGKAFITNPGDTEIDEIAYYPEPNVGEPAFVMKGLRVVISTQVGLQVEALQAVIPFLANMTKEEALARIEQMRIAGDIAENLAPVLAQIINLFIQ